jgi:hypothetical protein
MMRAALLLNIIAGEGERGNGGNGRSASEIHSQKI